MNYILLKRIIARSTYELKKAGISTQTNFETAITAMVKLHVDGDPVFESNAWIRIFAAANHLSIMFGNIKSGKSYTLLAAKPEIPNHKIWIPCMREEQIAVAELVKIFPGLNPLIKKWESQRIGGQNE